MKALNNKGASAVEFAIILPILVVLLFGIIEFGIYIYDTSVITNASREGARYGVLYNVDPTTQEYTPYTAAEIQDHVLNDPTSGTLSSKLITLGSAAAVPTVASAWSPSATAGSELSVTVSYPFSFLVLPNFIATPGPISATTVMRMEGS